MSRPDAGDRPVVRPYGDEALLVDLPDLAAVRELDAALRADASGASDAVDATGVVDVVPAARTVLLRTRPGTDLTALAAHVLRVWDATVLSSVPGGTSDAGVQESAGGPVVELPVRYDGEDLPAVAELVGLSVEEVVARHAAVEYTVAFGGFMPGFAYLTGLDPRLRVPRLPSPRERVPAGSVAVADEFSAVYPAASPGGWRLLGVCDVPMFDVHRTPPALLTPGARVRFVPLAAAAGTVTPGASAAGSADAAYRPEQS